jgi:NTP pyrophosphatase (non-canonical NTP hydrolase)
MTDTALNDLARECHEMAVAKGWYEGGRDFPELIALLHSELSEALEEWRRGQRVRAIWHDPRHELENTAGNPMYKPCGIPIEIADLIIRALDLCGYYGIDIDAAIAEKMAYNALRPRRHGGKRA